MVRAYDGGRGMRLGAAVAAFLATGIIANVEAYAAGAEIANILGTRVTTYTESCDS